MSDKSTDMSDKMSDMSDKSQREIAIITYLKVNEYITNKDVQELLTVTEKTAMRTLRAMSDKKLIISSGEKKARKYRLSDL